MKFTTRNINNLTLKFSTRNNNNLTLKFSTRNMIIIISCCKLQGQGSDYYYFLKFF
jgi:hypothetical protein